MKLHLSKVVFLPILGLLGACSHFQNAQYQWCDNASCCEEVASAVVQASAPIAVIHKKLSLSSDALFQFDGDTLDAITPATGKQLEQLNAELEKIGMDNIQRVTVRGYTDYLGAETYNQHLSTRRAESIVNWLVNRGIAPQKMTAQGLGESNPISVNCPTTSRDQLIACLQVDRRVTIDFEYEQ